MGDIKKIMMGTRMGKLKYAILFFGAFLAWEKKIICGAMGRLEARHTA
ncbi:hypothetical protein ACFS07_35130 [Undibacterium arcticum]